MKRSVIAPPESMVHELSEWNDGNGIDLKSWIGCMGNFKLAVGYAALFCPRFVLFEDYILKEDFNVESLRGFEAGRKGDKRSVECVMNHLHIAGIQAYGCEDISEDKILFIGRAMKEIWEAKLSWQFPDRPCDVSFYEPEDRTDLVAFELSFWQKKHAKTN
jgi:hypothetical protein